MTTNLETLPAADKKSAGAGKPTNHRKPRESRGTLAFSRAQRTKSLVKHAILILAGGLMIYPLLWMVVSSLRPNELIFREPGLWLESLEMSNYTSGWSALTHPFGHYMINSAVVVIGSILGNLISCSMAAYAFARLQFTGKKLFFGIMLLTIMLPFHVIIVPQYILFSQIGWVNTFWPLIVPKLLATDAFFVFLMVQFIRGIPKELDEAARIDGAGHPRIFLRVILPLMVPALATTTIFTFIWTWNDFFGALIYLTDPDMFTVPVALRAFVDSQSATSWGSLFAMSIVSLLPVFLVFLFGQRFLIKGIATTGIK
ncbi:carbohydrate ABC transporter permease [Pseudarthrobacter enclensis]|jgi:multiple sugar transport system permease protein|uniref:Sugar ABC transporter permease n=1 Tax=Pseudarthrobacter enclensis TaxID=993070 RepID=A0A0V8IV30_9MICC|nr:carbohydrate ABC transporter permease [Pseudarthrobacter enclensis]KSU78551.1 sugar ABC transporter permease [Pseudarthrobacter enclensis]BCW20357.1 sugar ABC transporter permease [Arthrobacter sp. NtRootA9]SCB72861.1 carbohydrate ABC transporter membrane protein 2, CUT1 family [Pseudarthrobacter enclensis]